MYLKFESVYYIFRFVAKDVPELDSALKSHILQDYEVDR